MHKKGFTLIEILLVIIIVGILAAITIPRVLYNTQQARIAACNANVSALNSQIELWNLNQGAFPTPLASITGSANYFPDGAPVCPFASTYVLGANNRVTLHTH